MSRATPITQADATPEQREVWDAIVESRGDPSRLVGPDGGLIGPFNAMVSSPITGARVAALGQAIRFSNAVDNRLLELAIITVGAHWRSNFEWWAHSRLAVDAGIDQTVVDALADGRRPSFVNGDEEQVHRYASALVTTGRVDDQTHADTVELLGEQGLIDLTFTIGYYCMISLTLNALAVPLPEGHEPTWDQ